MKKYITLLSLLLLFFVPIKTKAQAMPSPSNTTFTLIENGNQYAIWGEFLNYGIFPFLPEQAQEIIVNRIKIIISLSDLSLILLSS